MSAIEFERSFDWELGGKAVKITVVCYGEVSFDWLDGSISDLEWNKPEVWVGDDLLADWSKLSKEEADDLKAEVKRVVKDATDNEIEKFIGSLPDGPEPDEYEGS